MSVKPKLTDSAATTETPVPAALVAPPAAALAATPKMIEAAAIAAKTESETITPEPGVTQASTKQGMEKAMKTAEELVAFSQGNFEAFLKSGQVWAAGMQDLSKQMAATAQANLDETMSAFKAMTTAKSLKDAFDLQAGLARSTMEKTLAETGRLTDASFKLTEQAMAPITARVTLAVEKFAKTV
ncbi:MAG: phasin family protein [Acetobacteraceae bacterium]